jgi:hypothetical protein
MTDLREVDSRYPTEGTPVLPFLVGASFAIPIGTRAGASLGHLLLLFLLPVTVPVALRFRPTRWIVLGSALWFVAALLTDRIRGVGLSDSYIGFVRPGLLLVAYLGFAWLYAQGARAALSASAGLLLGVCTASFIYQPENFAINAWKYALGDPVTLAVVGLAAFAALRGRLLVAVTALCGIATVNVWYGFRSELGILIVAVVCAVVAGRRRRPQRVSTMRLMLGIGVALAIAYPAYGTLANAGLLGVQQQDKWARQSQVTGGVLIGARPELVAASDILSQSPVLGRGTGFNVDTATESKFLLHLQQLGIDIDPADAQFFFGQGVYLHSALFQTWADSGILTLPGMVIPLVLLLLAARRAIGDRTRGLVLLFAFLAAQYAWDLLFSPWPRLGPTVIGAATAGAVVLLNERNARDNEWRAVAVEPLAAVLP